MSFCSLPSLRPLHGCGARIAAAGLCLSTASASANIGGTYHAPDDLRWYVTDMPDFDQRRAFRPANVPFVGLDPSTGLPGDGGMYCVPTATLNMFAYAANHGYPSLLPGDATYSQWMTPSYDTPFYDDATLSLAALGDSMGTHAVNGTGSAGWYAGADAWTPDDLMDVGMFAAKGTWAPLGQHLGQVAHNTGGLVSLAWGNYSWESDQGPDGETGLMEFNGGHAVTLSWIDVKSSIISDIQVKNPATGDSKWEQHTDETQGIRLSNWHVFLPEEGVREMSKMTTPGSPSNYRVMTALGYVVPKQGLIQKPTGRDITVGTVKGLAAPHLQNQRTTMSLGGTESFESIEFCPMRTHQLGLVASADPSTGVATKSIVAMVATREGREANGTFRIDTPVDPAAIEIHYGTDMLLYVLTPSGVECYEADSGFAYQHEATLGLPSGFQGDALSFDENTMQLVVVDTLACQVAVFPVDGARSGDTVPAVAAFPCVSSAPGKTLLEFDPETGGFFVGHSATNAVAHVEMDASGAFVQTRATSIPGAAGLTSISPDGAGGFYVCTTGHAIQYFSDSGTGTFGRDRTGFFDGETGSAFQITRSRTNHGSLGGDVSDGPIHVDASEVFQGSSFAGCLGDVTTTNTNPGDEEYGAPDGNIDGADLSYYVELWLNTSPNADWTTDNTNPGETGYGQADGIVSGADLSYYVEAWITGCG